MGGLRYAHIGLAVGLTILAVGGLLFRDSEAALLVVYWVAFITTFIVYHGLDERNKRRRRRGQ